MGIKARSDVARMGWYALAPGTEPGNGDAESRGTCGSVSVPARSGRHDYVSKVQIWAEAVYHQFPRPRTVRSAPGGAAGYIRLRSLSARNPRGDSGFAYRKTH